MSDSTNGGWIERLRQDPRHALVRAAAILRARIIFRAAALGRGVGASGRVRFHSRGRCRIGARTTFLGGIIPTHIQVERGAALEIGEGAVFNYGAFVEVHDRVRIGSRCLIASLVRISDLDGDREGAVTIGDDVWIAHGAIVLPGVTIGDGSVISAGSVITRDVPPGHLATGNPARTAPLGLVAVPSEQTSNRPTGTDP